MLRRRDGLRGPCQQELDDRRGSALEICRAVRVACLDALEHETVEQGEDAAGHGVDIERGGELTIDDSLAEQQLTGTRESLAASRQHLPDAPLAVRLRPSLDETDLAPRAGVFLDGIHV